MRSKRFKKCVAEFMAWKQKSAWKLVKNSAPPEVDMSSKPTYRYPTQRKSATTAKLAPKMSKMRIGDDDDDGEVYVDTGMLAHDDDDNQFLDDFVVDEIVETGVAISDL